MGIVYQPYTDELFWAQEGKGAWRQEERIYVSGVRELEKSLVTVGTSPWDHDLAEDKALSALSVQPPAPESLLASQNPPFLLP